MKYIIAFLIAALLLWAILIPADAQETGDAKGFKKDQRPFSYDYYYVSENTFKKLARETLTRGPSGPDGKIYPALTRFVFNFAYSHNYTYERENRGDNDRVVIKVTFKNIAMNREIKVVLPRLVKGVKLSPKDQALWEKNLKSLEEHEMDHVRIVTDPRIEDRFRYELQQIDEIIVYLRPDQILTDKLAAEIIKDRADMVRERVTKRVDAINFKFDELTGHGLKPYDREKFFAWVKY